MLYPDTIEIITFSLQINLLSPGRTPLWRVKQLKCTGQWLCLSQYCTDIRGLSIRVRGQRELWSEQEGPATRWEECHLQINAFLFLPLFLLSGAAVPEYPEDDKPRPVPYLCTPRPSSSAKLHVCKNAVKENIYTLYLEETCK